MLVETSKNILQLQFNKVYILQEQIISFICSEDSWKFQNDRVMIHSVLPL